MKQRLLVTGAGGLLGSAIVRAAAPDHEVIAFGRTRPEVPSGVMSMAVDVRDAATMSALVSDCPPDTIVHCAADTRVDFCEDHPDEAFAVNADATQTLAEAAARAGATLLFVSTDSVFDGRSGGYTEEHPTAPLNVYSQSKARAEQIVAASTAAHIIVRTSHYGWSPTGRPSLAQWVLGRLSAGLDVPGFADVVFNPLFVDDVAGSILATIDRGLRGVYHLGARDTLSKFEFARRLASRFGYDPARVVPVSVDAAAFRAPRPRLTWLDVSRAEAALGRRMPSVDESLERFREREARTASSG